MACSAIQVVNGDGKVIRVKFMTVQEEGGLVIDTFLCDENFIPVGNPTRGTHEMDEETWHRGFRKEAGQRAQYVPEESTNPEWNEDPVQSGVSE